MPARVDPASTASPSSESDLNPKQAASPEETSVLLDLMPHILETLKREPALAITFGYLLVAMAGIFYNYSYYQKFDIPVVMLSQINDFLVAGIQEPMALLLVLSTFPLCWLFDKFNSRSRRRRARKLAQLRQIQQPSFWYRQQMRYLVWRGGRGRYMGFIYVLVVIAYGGMFVSRYADHRADVVKKGDAQHVQIWLAGDNNALPAQAKTWTYLGAVSNYVFVYDHISQRSEILPVNNITRIEPVATPKKPVSDVIILPVL